MSAEEAITYIEECRSIHWVYAQRQRAGFHPQVDLPVEPTTKYVGDVGGPEWHDEWVRRYDVVLEALRRSGSTPPPDRRPPLPEPSPVSERRRLWWRKRGDCNGPT